MRRTTTRIRGATPGALLRLLPNESTKYRPYTLVLPRLVIIKRYKREADCARLIAPLWRTNACETKREKLYGRVLKNDSSSW